VNPVRPTTGATNIRDMHGRTRHKHGRVWLLAGCAALGVLAMAAAPAESSAEVQQPLAADCAGAATTTTGPTGTTKTETIKPGSPPPHGGTCWEEVEPYPFGSRGVPVTEPSVASCGNLLNSEENCPLTVTSMAFRAWNRGLAVTTALGKAGEPTTEIWIFNGVDWLEDTTFLGSKSCPGNTIVWAGQKDYWLVGPGPEDNWPNICRFDGEPPQWVPEPLPPVTKARVEGKPGGITSGACFAWNDCWFFGNYGTVVHWAGEPKGQSPLTDVSPEASQTLLQGEYTAAAAREGPSGEALGLAGSATSGRFNEGPLTKEADVEGQPLRQVYGSTGGAFSPLAFTPFMIPLGEDPYRTDVVAVDLDSAGQGWVAGNPAGLRLKEREGKIDEVQAPSQENRKPQPETQPQEAPLQPVSASGEANTCAGPPEKRFTYTPFISQASGGPGAFLWSSIAVLPGSNDALAGGQLRQPSGVGSGPNEDAGIGQPVIAQAGCDGTTSVTSFPIEDPTSKGSSAPADREGGVTAIAATNAGNEAWAATSGGALGPIGQQDEEPPRLYRLTNGEPPDAPEGAEGETRPLPEVEAPRFVFEPEPPVEEAAPEVATVAKTRTVKLPAAIYDVKAKLHTTKRGKQVNLSLYISFKLRRPVTVGAQALRHGRVVSRAKPRHFTGHSGQLILSLNRQHWPTNVKFVT